MLDDLTQDTFESLQRRLAELPNQTMGNPSAVCETGEQYVVFSELGLARPDDVKTIEAEVAARMSRRLHEYLDKRFGRIYWRIPFEYEISDYGVIIRYDENGIDIDPTTNRKCVMDKKWKRVACYCRLYRASMVAPAHIVVLNSAA